MATLTNLVVRISGNTAELNKSITQSQTRIERFAGSARTQLRLVGDQFRDTARQVPVLGDNLAALPPTAAVATGAVAALGFALGKAVQHVVNLERGLRPMIERSRFSAETLQVMADVAERLGSEDGLEGVVDTSQELQLQLGEIALTGKSRAVPALEALNLAAKDLNDLEPEQAWLRVVEAIQQIPDVTDRAIIAEEIFGGTSEKLAGIINATSGEFATLTEEIERTHRQLSDEELERTRQFSNVWDDFNAVLESVALTIGIELITELNSLIAKGRELKADVEVIRDVFVSAFEKIKTEATRDMVELRQSWSRLSGAIESIYNNGFGQLFGADGTIANAVRLFRSAWDSVWGAISSGFDRYVSPIRSALTGLSRSLGRILDLFRSIRNFRLPQLPSIPGFAEGVRNFRGGFALVGEEGPEIVHLPKGSDVIPNARSMQSFSSISDSARQSSMVVVRSFQRAVTEQVALMFKLNDIHKGFAGSYVKIWDDAYGSVLESAKHSMVQVVALMFKLNDIHKGFAGSYVKIWDDAYSSRLANHRRVMAIISRDRQSFPLNDAMPIGQGGNTAIAVNINGGTFNSEMDVEDAMRRVVRKLQFEGALPA